MEIYEFNRINGKPSTNEQGYKSTKEQLDLLWHDIDDGKFGADAKTGAWYLDVKAVKERFPKT
jgi:hypothetical protein|tara:strand:+ start:664 stop:852 length:189 start_codon:yes stop_codon:yes gene_type:complete